MAQADGIVSNASGAAVRADLNNQLAAVFTNHSGSTEPSTTYAYQWWADTTNGVMKLRNAANSAWITMFQLDGEWTSLALENGSAASPSIYFKDSGTDTGVYSPGTDQVGISTAGVQRVNFNGSTEVVFNDGGNDVDFRIEGDTNPDLFKIDAGADQVQVANLNGGPLAGTRNRIINGDMRIDQRNAGASVTATSGGVFVVDRWDITEDTDGTMTAQQSATAPAGFTSSVLVTTTSADASLGASQYAMLSQRIEGLNVSVLAWGTASAQPVVLSFWVRSSLTGTFGGALRNSAADRSYPFTYAISAANTWELKTVAISGDTTGTWLGTNGIGIRLTFGLGAGSSLSGTAGAWASTNVISTTGATSVVGTNGATFYITGVQLEPGSVATPFERRSYGQELALSQRYHQTGAIIRYAGPTNIAQGNDYSVLFPVSMRSSPTVTFSSTSFTGAVTGVSATNITTQGFVASFGTNATSTGTGVGTVTATIEL